MPQAEELRLSLWVTLFCPSPATQTAPTNTGTVCHLNVMSCTSLLMNHLNLKEKKRNSHNNFMNVFTILLSLQPLCWWPGQTPMNVCPKSTTVNFDLQQHTTCWQGITFTKGTEVFKNFVTFMYIEMLLISPRSLEHSMQPINGLWLLINWVPAHRSSAQNESKCKVMYSKNYTYTPNTKSATSTKSSSCLFRSSVKSNSFQTAVNRRKTGNKKYDQNKTRKKFVITRWLTENVS